MTGTAREVAPELEAVYGLKVVRMPTNRPVRRTDLGRQMYTTAEHKWAAVAEAVARARGAGRPVLVGTRSVAASEELSDRLAGRGLDHVVLNARQDGDEAQIVAAAGEAGRITVATNMAGRGTDIRLAPEVAARGGLHVILTEFHESARIDRQLYGRCGRQGDPGSFEAIVCLEDDIFRKHAARSARALTARYADASGPLPRWAATALQRFAQGGAEAENSRARQATLDLDRQFDQALSFAGRGE
jgi:preprotein translocase subunit SecA